jgi:hypothetical protein
MSAPGDHALEAVEAPVAEVKNPAAILVAVSIRFH